MNSLKNKTRFLPLTLGDNDQTERPVANQLIASRGAAMNCKREPVV